MVRLTRSVTTDKMTPINKETTICNSILAVTIGKLNTAKKAKAKNKSNIKILYMILNFKWKEMMESSRGILGTLQL